MNKILLASASPRRGQLLKQIGLKFDVAASLIEEKMDNNDVKETVQRLSFLKAKDIANKVGKGYIVIGADTAVVYQDNVLGKPRNYSEAYETLGMLSGNIHYVVTGFTILRSDDEKFITDYEKTLVKFRDILEEEIDAYIKTEEPMDKAGSYGIQGIGSLFVERIEGDYFNIVGLPIAKVAKVLTKEFGVKVLAHK